MPTGLFAGCAEDTDFAGADTLIITCDPRDAGGSAGLP